jgi:hypothetical protein
MYETVNGVTIFVGMMENYMYRKNIAMREEDVRAEFPNFDDMFDPGLQGSSNFSRKQLVLRPEEIAKVTFFPGGKYKNSQISDIAETDIDYLFWFERQEFGSNVWKACQHNIRLNPVFAAAKAAVEAAKEEKISALLDSAYPDGEQTIDFICTRNVTEMYDEYGTPYGVLIVDKGDRTLVFELTGDNDLNYRQMCYGGYVYNQLTYKGKGKLIKGRKVTLRVKKTEVKVQNEAGLVEEYFRILELVNVEKVS